MTALTFTFTALKGGLLLAGLLAPGAAVMHALRAPRTIGTCFTASALALYVTVLALNFCGVPISLGSLSGGLLVIGLIATGVAQRRNASDDPAPDFFAIASLRGLGAWVPLYALFWIAALWRAWHEPLAGADVEFRWGYLAEQMLRHGSLDFYPPQSARDFLNYFWVESIPPGASALHAWAFACAGGSNAAWTVPAVALQLWSLHELIAFAAQRIGGGSAARGARLAAAACPLLTWTGLLGQETGLTALSLTGMAWALLEWQHAAKTRWAALAGLFAATGASAREYGLIFPALGIAALVLFRADRRAWGAFASFAVISLLWPLRTWLLTGNPFYSLAVGHLFPVNDLFVAWVEHEAAELGNALTTAAGWKDLARYTLLFAAPALVGWLSLALAAARARRDAVWALGAVAVTLALWAISVRFTNGGLFYSLRVASPALALGATAAGVAVGARRLSAATSLALAAFVGATLPIMLALPQNFQRTPWREWPAFAPRLKYPLGAEDETVRQFLSANSTTAREQPGVVVADGPGFQRRFAATGIRVVPLWSPQARWLFDPALRPADALRAWEASGVTHVVLLKWQTNLDFFAAHVHAPDSLLALRPIAENTYAIIYRVERKSR